MNSCHFVGRFTHNPVLTPNEDNTANACYFTLAIVRKFKRNNGETGEQTNFIDFEVWDSAADVITRNFRKNDMIVIDNASARNTFVEDEDSGKRYNITRFRVERFSSIDFRE